MSKNVFLLSIIATLFFSSCSVQKVYEPENVSSDWEKSGESGFKIVAVSSNVAQLADARVFTKQDIVDTKIDENNRLIAKSDSWIITSTLDGVLTLLNSDENQTIVFELKKTIATANVKENLLAVLFADGEMALYDIFTKDTILKEQGTKAITVNAKIAQPYFMDTLVLFPTLDGKVVIVNSELKKKLRTVIVSTEDNFNNVIFLDVIDNKIIAATSTKILSLSQKEIREKYEIRDILYDGESIFVATKQGQIVSLTANLQVNVKEKFPFAHFVSMISNEDKLYVLEKEGYILVIDKQNLAYTVHEVDVEDGFIFTNDTTFYIADEYISIK